MEQCTNTNVCLKLGKRATETFKMITPVYDNGTMGEKKVLKLYARFRDGREMIHSYDRH